jgi:dipicolinate synthase subunit B
MKFSNLKIGFGITGSHCTIAQVLPVMQLLKDEGAKVIPILSQAVLANDTRYGTVEELLRKIIDITGETPLVSLVDVEPIGPKQLLDVVVVAPCTGNTLAKLSLGVTDSSVLLACKAELRNNRPVVIAISTNDGLSANAKNLGLLLNRKNIFFVPFGQDAPQTKQASLIAKMSLLPETILEALQNRQIQPLLVTV